MNKFLLLAGASVFAIGVGTQAKAATLAALCGTTVSVDTKVEGTVEALTDTTTCEIELSGGAALSIKDAEISLADELTIFGAGSVVIRDDTMLNTKNLNIMLTSGDITIKNTDIDFDVTDTQDGEGDSENPPDDTDVIPPQIWTGSGEITFKDNMVVSPFDAAARGFKIYGGGDVTVKDTDFNLTNGGLDIGSTGGDIDVIGNTFDAGSTLPTNIKSLGGNVVVNKNTGSVFQMTIEGVDVTYNENTVHHSQTFQIDADGDLMVKENDFGNPNSLDFEFGGSCDAKDNIDPVFVCP